MVLRNYQQNVLQHLSPRVGPSDKQLKRFKTMASSVPSENGVQCSDPSAMQLNKEMHLQRKILDASFDCTPIDMDMLQALHETARLFYEAVEKKRSLMRGPWFAKAWRGVDHSAWIKSIAYQAAVHSLIEALLVIARRQESRNSFVSSKIQKSFLRLQNPLQESIQQHLCARDSAAEAWLWNQQHPVAVNNLLSNLKESSCSFAVDTIYSSGASLASNKNVGLLLFMLSLSILASIMKLGTGKLSCLAFSCSLVEETSYLMDELAEFSSIERVYEFTSSIGFRKEFLKHFGLRAALHTKTDQEERLFWVRLIQKLLETSLTREGLCSKLPSALQLEVLDRSLVVFAFFTTLGRRARSLLLSKNVQIEGHLLGLFRYLEGGYVIFRPELANLATYQLFVEVASEDLEWLLFFDNDSMGTIDKSKNLKDGVEQPSTNDEATEAIAAVLEVCSYWVDDFILYNNRLLHPQSAEETKYLSNIQSILYQCIMATNRQSRRRESSKNLASKAAIELDQLLKSLLNEDLIYTSFAERAKAVSQTLEWKQMQKDFQSSGDILLNNELHRLQGQIKALDEDLHMVEKILFKLEGLLTGSDLSRLQNGIIHLTAINISLQKIRRLKREAQALERSLQHKASIKEQHLIEQKSKLWQRHDDQEKIDTEKDNKYDGHSPQPQTRPPMGGSILIHDLVKDSVLKESLDAVTNDEAEKPNVHNSFQRAFEVSKEKTLVSEEVTQLGALQSELYQLDFRIREYVRDARSADMDGANVSHRGIGATNQKDKAWDFIRTSTKKLKDASMDALKGTQLLATDVSVAISLLQYRVSGHKLTEREKRILLRTCTDLASVIPIGVLMLLPVTAIGHAAMLSAIQKYVPALIPSAYGAERLYLLKQLERIKELDGCVFGDKVPLEDFNK